MKQTCEYEERAEQAKSAEVSIKMFKITYILYSEFLDTLCKSQISHIVY